MSTTSNPVPGEGKFYFDCFKCLKLLSISAWVRTEFMNCLMTVALKDSVWGLPGRSAEWLWRIYFECLETLIQTDFHY